MIFQDAERVLGQVLSPLTIDEFLDQALAGGPRYVAYDGQAGRLELLGADPQATLLGAPHLAAKLTWHSANPAGPAPSLSGVASRSDFRRRIGELHARNYSVRFPELRPLSPALDRFARALEVLLHQPVTASAFWSRGGMRAPVHYDDHDLIVIQQAGTKRWYVSTGPSQLFNPWKGVSGNPPDLGQHAVVDMRPGDLLYLPRGTFHTVDSDAESVHLAIGFTPLTVREAVVAALDHLSDVDRDLRTTLGGRLGAQLRAGQADQLAPAVLEAATRLHTAIRTPGFLGAALTRRSARTVGGLDALPRPDRLGEVGLDTVVARRETATCHLTANAETIDVSYPGGHLYIHRGALESVAFIADTPRFRIRDIPGAIADEARLALATRFLEVGFLVALLPV